jgi:hypothetical protein
VNPQGAANDERNTMVDKWMMVFDRMVFDTLNYRQESHIDRVKLNCDELAGLGITSPKGLDDSPFQNNIKKTVFKNCYSVMGEKYLTKLGLNYHK